MAVRATNEVTSDAYIVIKRTASQLKVNVDAWIPFLAANTVGYDYVNGMYQHLYNADAKIDTLKTTSGLAAYAQDQEDDSSYDFQTEVVALLVSVTDAFTWIEDNIPLDVTLLPINQWKPSSSNVATPELSPSGSATLRALLQTVTDSIV